MTTRETLEVGGLVAQAGCSCVGHVSLTCSGAELVTEIIHANVAEHDMLIMLMEAPRLELSLLLLVLLLLDTCARMLSFTRVANVHAACVSGKCRPAAVETKKHGANTTACAQARERHT